MKFEKVKKVQGAGLKKIYHLTVKNNHNFFANGFCLHNCDYTGEIKVILFNTNPNDVVIKKGMKVAQGVLASAISGGYVSVSEVDVINEKTRGSNGFGSTGI